LSGLGNPDGITSLIHHGAPTNTKASAGLGRLNLPIHQVREQVPDSRLMLEGAWIDASRQPVRRMNQPIHAIQGEAILAEQFELLWEIEHHQPHGSRRQPFDKRGSSTASSVVQG
jgi:hypothetical protein